MRRWRKISAPASIILFVSIVVVAKRGANQRSTSYPKLTDSSHLVSDLPDADSAAKYGVWRTASLINSNQLSPSYRLALDDLQKRFELVESSMMDTEILETLQLHQFKGHLEIISQYQRTGGGTNLRSIHFENGAELSFSDFMGNTAKCTLRIPDEEYSKMISISGHVDMSGLHNRGFENR